MARGLSVEIGNHVARGRAVNEDISSRGRSGGSQSPSPESRASASRESRSLSPRPPWKTSCGAQIGQRQSLSHDRSSIGTVLSKGGLNDSVISEAALAAIKLEHEAHIERTAHIEQLRREKELRKRDEQHWVRGVREQKEFEKARSETEKSIKAAHSKEIALIKKEAAAKESRLQQERARAERDLRLREQQDKKGIELEQQRLALLKANAVADARRKIKREEMEKQAAEAKLERAWLVEERREQAREAQRKRQEERAMAAPGVCFKPTARASVLESARDSWAQSPRQLYGRVR